MYFINFFGRALAGALQLPIWFDSLGTCLAAYYTNIYGALTAAVAINIIAGTWNPIFYAYIIVGIILACAFRLSVKRGYMDALTPAMIFSFVAGVITVIAATPLDVIFNNGYTGNMWGDALYEMLSFKGYPSAICTLADESIINIIDKQTCVLWHIR